MKNIYEILKERVDSLNNRERIQYHTDEDVRLNMTIHEDTDVFSPYCGKYGEIVSMDVIEFIDSMSLAVRGYNIAGLDIYSDCLDDKEKLRVKTGIRNSYDIKAIENERICRANRLAITLFSIIGITVLALSIWCYSVDYIPEIVCYIVDTIGCVVLWSAIDSIISDGTEIRQERKRLKFLREMEINFYELKEEK